MPKDSHDQPNDGREKGEEKPELLTHPSHEELLKKLDEAEQKADQYWERLLRMQADSDNILRRAERDVANAHKYALEKFVSELIPIVESLELCVENETKLAAKDTASLVEGVKMTLNMFYAALEKFGVKQINPVGETFDSEFQQAISMQYDPKVKPGTIVSVLQKGYTLNNRLIRPALVVVSKAEQ